MTEVGVDIFKTKQLLDEGEVVAIPTETVYGLAANALDEKAVVKIFEAKNRPYFNPLIIHIPDANQLASYVEDIPDTIQKLMAKHWPGPLTVLLKKNENIPDIVTAGSPLVAVRVPQHPMCQELLQKLDYPLAAPSANPFGYISPVTAKHVSDQLKGKIPYVLDGGTSQIGLESTIVGYEDEQVVVYRLGGVSLEEIEKKCGSARLMTKSENSPQTSGMLKHHYSPTKELLFFEKEILLSQLHEKDCILSFDKYEEFVSKEKQFLLSPKGDLNEAASNLFPLLHQLDKSSLSRILVKKLPEKGLGRAINDRLKRASSNY